jgi:exosortase/archaeosortase family protein
MRRFLFSFFCVLGFFHAGILTLPDSILAQTINLTCGLSAFLANILGTTSSWEPGFITVEGFKIHINLECTAIQFLSIYVAGVLAYPYYDLRYKIIGIIWGVCFLFGMNILRIAVLGLIGARSSHGLFDFIHNYLWQGTYALLVFAAWYTWMRREWVTNTMLRFWGRCFAISAAVFFVLGAVMEPYLMALASLAQGLYELSGAVLDITAQGDRVIFGHSGTRIFFPISVDVMDSTVFFALVTAASWRGFMAGRIKGLFLGGGILSCLHLILILVAGHLVMNGIRGEMQQSIMWVMRGASIVAPFLLWFYLMTGLKVHGSERTVYHEEGLVPS